MATINPADIPPDLAAHYADAPCPAGCTFCAALANVDARVRADDDHEPADWPPEPETGGEG